MRLRSKVLLILLSLWAVILIATLTYSHYTLIRGYQLLEQDNVIAEISRTRKTVDALMTTLKILNRDWSQWDDAYRFMRNRNQTFITSNLAASTFKNAKINLILFFDNNGKLFYGRAYDLESNKFTPIPANVIQSVQSEIQLIRSANTTTGTVGLLKSSDGYVILSSMPILSSRGAGPTAGYLVMGYFLKTRHVSRIAEILGNDIQATMFPLPQDDVLLNKAYEKLKTQQEFYITPLNDNQIVGFSYLHNINNEPIGILKITMPRTFYNQGHHTIDRYLTIIAAIGLIYVALIWYLLKIFVLDRIINVSRQAITIQTTSAFSTRIQISGADEIKDMVNSLNDLLQIIELSENQLRMRLTLRTDELTLLSTLNKNLQHEMENQKKTQAHLEAEEKSLQQMAYYDLLTGLPNRYYFKEQLRTELTKSNRDHTQLALLFIDADKFKPINDTYGHVAGDQFLKHAAQQLKLSLRPHDILARVGGDEFIVCLPDIKDKDQIDQIAHRILQNMQSPIHTDDIQIKSTFSIGISIYPTDSATLKELLEHADLAMFYAKKKNGNTFYYYDQLVDNHGA